MFVFVGVRLLLKEFPEHAFIKRVMIIISLIFEKPLELQVLGQLSRSLDRSRISNKSLNISS